MPAQPSICALAATLVAMWLTLLPPAAAKDAEVSYRLGPKALVQQLYPDATWLPEAYKPCYPDLAATVKHYTLQSLQRDGVKGAKVRVDFTRGDTPQVRVAISPRNAVTRRYARVHPAFLGTDTAQAALRAIIACRKDAGCWTGSPPDGPAPVCLGSEPWKLPQPWAMYLPLGMAMVKVPLVMFMDYPPALSLRQGDYLNNYTLCRWNQVLASAGVANPAATNVIVDSIPVATKGAGLTSPLPGATEWFDSSKGAEYLTPMLRWRTTPQAVKVPAGRTLPVAVFGGGPRAAWGQIVGQSDLKPLATGETALAGQAAKTPWITTNHPDVTTYQCCPGDPSARCKPGDTQLVASLQTDFIAACWIKTMSGPDAPGAAAAEQRCTDAWATRPPAANRQALCIQAKFDNNNPEARCSNYTEAWNYCAAHGANACASNDCRYDPAQVGTKAPAASRQPPGLGQVCSGGG